MNNPLKMDETSTKNQPKIDQQSMKIEVWRGSERILAFKRVLEGAWAALKSETVANMASSWGPKLSQNREKIDAKIDQKIDAFQKRYFLDFYGFWEGKWSQVGTKIVLEIDVNFERPIFTKPL